jgi:phosphoribosylformimino-5-aminoimidazole carboxamide ribotide isomerase
MIIIPAIDLKDQKCVRLEQGLADRSRVYSEDPVAMARHWVSEGAEYLHVVDLDGAFGGKPMHTEIIGKIIESIDIPVEIGGGLRSDEDIQAVLDLGAARAILGTRVLKDAGSLAGLVERFGDKLAVGIDARDGIVQVEGWIEGSKLTARDLAKDVAKAGVSTIICTDTSKDGMMAGTNVSAVEEICNCVTCDVIASGGVTAVSDVVNLTALGKPNLIGAIVGKALYEKTTTISELKNA